MTTQQGKAYYVSFTDEETMAHWGLNKFPTDRKLWGDGVTQVSLIKKSIKLLLIMPHSPRTSCNAIWHVFLF